MGWKTIAGQGGFVTDYLLSLDSDKPRRVHALLPQGAEPHSFWSHFIIDAKRTVTCLGKTICPACKAGIPSRMNHAMNVWDYSSDSVKVLLKGNQVYEPIKSIYEMNGNSLDSVDLVIKQSGKGKDTRYIVTSIAAKGKLEDSVYENLYILNDIFTPGNAEDIMRMMKTTEFPPREGPIDTPGPVDIDAPPVVEEITMPTGKYRGQTFAEIAGKDRNYVEWVVENFRDDEIRQAASHALAQTPRQAISEKDKERSLVAQALSLVRDYQSGGGDIKNVTRIMKSINAKTLILKEFSDSELGKFVEALEVELESLSHDSG